MSHSELKQMIWQVVAAIPEGKVSSYGHLAQMCGYPSHARYVGTTLKQLPADTELPWHRVVNAKGELSFAVSSDAYRQQQSRLEREGIIFSGTKIDLSVYGWD